jgi:hypothetical protein
MVGGRNGSDSQVRKSRALAFAAGAIGQTTGNSCGSHVKRQNATAIEMQHRLQPSRLGSGFSTRTLPVRFGYALGDFSDCDG